MKKVLGPWIHYNSVFILLGSGLNLLLFSPIRADPPGSTVDKILHKIRENDEALQNASLSYIKEWDEDLGKSFNQSKGRKNVNNGGILHLKFQEEMVVRSSTILFSAKLQNQAPKTGELPVPQEKDFFVAPAQRWGCLGDEVRDMFETGFKSEHENIVELKKSPGAVAIIKEQQMEVEFGLGIGYGKRILSVDQFNPLGDGFILKGTLKLYANDVSQYTIEVDREFIVRRATIHCDVEGNLNRFEVKTSGRKGSGLVRLAEKGHYRVTWEGARIKGKIVGNPHIRLEYAFRFLNLKVPLTDVEFEKKLFFFHIPTKSFVFDRIRHQRYVINEAGEKTVIDNDFDLKKPNSSFYWLKPFVVINIGFLFFVVVFWYLTKRYHKV